MGGRGAKLAGLSLPGLSLPGLSLPGLMAVLAAALAIGPSSATAQYDKPLTPPARALVDEWRPGLPLPTLAEASQAIVENVCAPSRYRISSRSRGFYLAIDDVRVGHRRSLYETQNFAVQLCLATADLRQECPLALENPDQSVSVISCDGVTKRLTVPPEVEQQLLEDLDF